MDPWKTSFIEFLVLSGAFKVAGADESFITKSGRASPYFINTGVFNTGSNMSILGDYYAQAIKEYKIETDYLFGPSYKGIPLAVSTSIALKKLYDRDVPFFFNRKEIKDHGEGGLIVGNILDASGSILIVDDVITAGTSVVESENILKNFLSLKIEGAIVSVDRKEKATAGQESAADSIKNGGTKIYSIVSIYEIVENLYNREIGGKVYIDRSIKQKIEDYLSEYGV